MSNNKQINGFIETEDRMKIPFSFENGILTLITDGNICKFEEGKPVIVGQKSGYIGEYILFHIPAGLTNYFTLNGQACSFGNITHEVDYYINGYKDNSKFCKMIFSFPELDHFLPSSMMCVQSQEHVIFEKKPKVINQYEFMYNDIKVLLSLRVAINGSKGYKAQLETKSEVVLEFSETPDFDFLLELYYIIHDLFCFVCNRKNITLHNVELNGTSTYRVFDDEKVVPTHQNLVIVDKYKEPYESDKKIASIPNYNLLSAKFENLVSLFFNNIVSISSIHSSVKAKKLIDLKHSLNLTSSFEYYQRTLTPLISSEISEQFICEIKELIYNYSESRTGKLRKKARDFYKVLKPEISLDEKICKVYYGYTDWIGLKNILVDRFGEDIKEMAIAAKDWRNELAHEKRSYEPTSTVIDSMRLVEHLNYCIVFRKAGYNDDDIKKLIEEILT